MAEKTAALITHSHPPAATEAVAVATSVARESDWRLVATAEAVAAGKRVTIVDQEPRSNLGGQAWWSFGGLFFIDSPEQRRLGLATVNVTVPGLVPIDFGWDRQRALHHPRVRTAPHAAGLLDHDLTDADLHRVPHPFP